MRSDSQRRHFRAGKKSSLCSRGIRSGKSPAARRDGAGGPFQGDEKATGQGNGAAGRNRHWHGGRADRRGPATGPAAAAKIWPGAPCYATDDLETALAAEEPADKSKCVARVLILSGTGSCCYGRRMDGKTRRFGGWGHILGDKGSGYEIGLRGMKASVHFLDREGRWPLLGQTILSALHLHDPEDLIDWAKGASKSEIAALAAQVFASAAKGDTTARDILTGAAESLAKDAVSCARLLVKEGSPVEFVFSGSVLLKQPSFARRVRAGLLRRWPAARVASLRRESAWGALALAMNHFGTGRAGIIKTGQTNVAEPETASLALSPTEQRNPRSKNLDRMSLAKAVALMIEEESKVGRALLKERKKIARLITWVAEAMRGGGRLFYVGAGTSGRLGVLDAVECPPTFRVSPERVQGILAGGPSAMWKSVEGAEDDRAAGASAAGGRGIHRRDVVIGIAASGRTPFVWGALAAARRKGAKTALICFNPQLKIPAADRPGLVIAPDVGPEVLTGSTRLKAGTATKIILNTVTTLAMVRLGKVVSNLMVDLKPSNRKLRERAVRIVQAITGADAKAARSALEKSGWTVKTASQKLGRTCPCQSGRFSL